MYLQNIDQALVVQKLASVIHWINLYPVDLVSIRETSCTIHWIEIYLMDPPFEQLGPGLLVTLKVVNI